MDSDSCTAGPGKTNKRLVVLLHIVVSRATSGKVGSDSGVKATVLLPCDDAASSFPWLNYAFGDASLPLNNQTVGQKSALLETDPGA